MEEKHDKRNTLISIWILGMFLLALMPIALPGVSATVTDITCYDAQSPNSTYCWVWWDVNDRQVYLKWDIRTALGVSAVFTAATLQLRVHAAYSPTGTIEMLGTDPWTTWALTTHPAESTAVLQTFSQTLTGWQNISLNAAMLSEIQDQYDANGWFYLKFGNDGHLPHGSDTWTCYPRPYSSGSNTSYPLLRLTYTIIPAWSPTITSSSAGNDTGYTNLPYSYHMTANESVTWAVNSFASPTFTGQGNSTADAYVSGASPDTNYGGNTALLMYSGGSDFRAVDIRWNDLALPGAIIQQAYVWLYCYSNTGTDGTPRFYALANATWGEMTLTSNNEPGLTGNVPFTPQGGTGWFNYTSSSLTSLISTQYSSLGNVSLHHATSYVTSEVGKAYYSKEYSGGAYAPGLILKYTMPNWLTINAQGYLNGTPLKAGVYHVNISATNALLGVDYQEFDITVSEPPTFTSSPLTTASFNLPYSYVVTSDAGTIALDSTNCTFLTFTPGNNTLWGRADAVKASYYVHLNLTGGGTLFAWQNFTITVDDYTDPVADAGPDQANIGEWMQFDGSGSSDNVGITNYTWTASGMVTGYGVTYNYAWGTSTGVKTVTLTVRDAVGRSDTDTMTVTVSASAANIIRPTADYSAPWPVYPTTPLDGWDKLREPDTGSDLDATYVYLNTTAGTNEYYDHDTYATTGVIVSVTLWAMVKKMNGATNPTYTLGTRRTGVNYAWVTTSSLTTSWANYSATMLTAPSTGLPWTVSDINGFRFWHRAVNQVGQTVNISQMGAIIDVIYPDPVFTSTPITTIYENGAHSYVVTTDIASTLSLDFCDAPWLTFSVGNSTLWGRAPAGAHFGYSIHLKAVGTLWGTISYQNYTLNVTVPWAPTYTSAPVLTGFNLVLYTYHITLNESSTFVYANGPAWLTANHNGTNGVSFYLNGTALTGTYTVRTRATSVAGGLIAYQNYTLVISLPPHPVFTSTPVTVAENGTFYAYTVTTDMACTFTLTITPAWLSYGAGTVSGHVPSVGAWLVNIEANSTAYGTTTNQTFTITASPLVPPIPVDEQWLALIPLIILIALVLLCSFSREGFSVTMMLGTAGIGIGVLVATDALPFYVVLVPVVIVAMMIYRGVRG